MVTIHDRQNGQITGAVSAFCQPPMNGPKQQQPPIHRGIYLLHETHGGNKKLDSP